MRLTSEKEIYSGPESGIYYFSVGVDGFSETIYHRYCYGLMPLAQDGMFEHPKKLFQQPGLDQPLTGLWTHLTQCIYSIYVTNIVYIHSIMGKSITIGVLRSSLCKTDRVPKSPSRRKIVKGFEKAVYILYLYSKHLKGQSGAFAYPSVRSSARPSMRNTFLTQSF